MRVQALGIAARRRRKSTSRLAKKQVATRIKIADYGRSFEQKEVPWSCRTDEAHFKVFDWGPLYNNIL